MRNLLASLPLMLCLAAVPEAHAQSPTEPGSPYVISDSTRILPRWLEGQIQAGIGWMGSPGFERQRYEAGLTGAAAAESRPAQWLALRARIAYLDLPPDPLDVFFVGGTATEFTLEIGHGQLVTGLLEASTPLPWALWLFGGAGGARYGSNAAAGVLLPDGSGFRPLEESGWGTAWSAGVRYRFDPNARDHFFLEGRSEAVQIGDGFRFWGLTLGYRFP